MNRRGFLKLFVGSVAVATLPIPNFLLPKEESPPHKVIDSYAAWYNSEHISMDGGVLTQEMIENAAIRAMENYGTPDYILLPYDTYTKFLKYFGYKIEYV